jgi:hypothetical protein
MNAREGVVFPLDACAHHVGTGAAPIGSRRSAPFSSSRSPARSGSRVAQGPGLYICGFQPVCPYRPLRRLLLRVSVFEDTGAG